jgi:hypothetical protein
MLALERKIMRLLKCEYDNQSLGINAIWSASHEEVYATGVGGGLRRQLSLAPDARSISVHPNLAELGHLPVLNVSGNDQCYTNRQAGVHLASR